jgi:hypothetical protein
MTAKHLEPHQSGPAQRGAQERRRVPRQLSSLGLKAEAKPIPDEAQDTLAGGRIHHQGNHVDGEDDEKPWRMQTRPRAPVPDGCD